jgi:hypothetical protein
VKKAYTGADLRASSIIYSYITAFAPDTLPQEVLMILRLRVRPSDGSKLLLGPAPFGRLLYIGIALFLALGMASLGEAPLAACWR